MTAAKTVERRSFSRRIVLLAALALSPFALFYAGRGAVRLAGNLLQRNYSPPGRMVSVGTYKLHLYCTGAGQPAIIIEPGMAASWTDWQFVASRLARVSRVCVYDRAGYGWSQTGPAPRTALAEAQDLHDLLLNAGIRGPHILVAHSYGGYIARVYAGLFGKSLAGVVLVDPAIEGERLTPLPLWRKILAFLPPTGAQRFVRLIRGNGAIPPELTSAPAEFQHRFLIAPSVEQQEAERSELASLPQTEAQVRFSRFPGDVALTVITARHLISPRQYYPPPVPEPPASHQEFHARLARQSLRGKFIVAEESGHQIETDQPQLIIDAVADIVRSSR